MLTLSIQCKLNFPNLRENRLFNRHKLSGLRQASWSAPGTALQATHC